MRKQPISLRFNQWVFAKCCVTHGARAHHTLVALLGGEKFVLVEGLPWLVNCTVVPAGLG